MPDQTNAPADPKPARNDGATSGEGPAGSDLDTDESTGSSGLEQRKDVKQTQDRSDGGPSASSH